MARLERLWWKKGEIEEKTERWTNKRLCEWKDRRKKRKDKERKNKRGLKGSFWSNFIIFGQTFIIFSQTLIIFGETIFLYQIFFLGGSIFLFLVKL